MLLPEDGICVGLSDGKDISIISIIFLKTTPKSVVKDFFFLFTSSQDTHYSCVFSRRGPQAAARTGQRTRISPPTSSPPKRSGARNDVIARARLARPSVSAEAQEVQYVCKIFYFFFTM